MAKCRLFIALILLLSSNSTFAKTPAHIKLALASGDYEVATTWLIKHANEPGAAFELGKLYRLGKGVKKNTQQAAILFEVAAQTGNPEAQYLLAKHYQKTKPALSQKWMQKASNSGHRLAKTLAAPAQSNPVSFQEIMRSHKRPADIKNHELLSTTDSFERTALMIAVEEHSLEWVAHLVKNSTLLDMQDKSGSTALHYAIHGKSKTVTKLLLDAGANPDIGTFDEERPLHLAIASKQLALANLLLKAGADVSLKNSSGWTPTALAKRSNDKNIRAALKIDASNSNIRLQRISEVQNLEKLFVDAVRRGDRELTEKLLNQGIDISSAEANGYTPLAHAVLNGQRDMVPLLLNRGAKTNTVFAQKQNLLHLAAKSSNADTLPLLITHSLDINATDAFHKTPLVLATQAGCEQCVTVLLRNGASAQIQDNDGKTPLIHALINRRASIAKQLLTQPDKHNLTDNAGRNALWWATKRGYLDIALNLLNSSTAPSLDLSKFNALHVAAEENHPALVEPLMELVNIDLKTRSGNTPLLLAAHAGSADALVLLIEAGANLDMPNARGDTALISAAKSENLECAKLLLDAGANPSIRNRNFESAFSIIELRNKPTGMMLIENYDGKLAKLL